MKIIYTETGRRALEEYKDSKAKELEKQITSHKYVFGDDAVEITANDVREAADKVRFPYRLSAGRYMTRYVLQLYVYIGVLTSIGGFFYRDLKNILSKDPTQLVLVVTGAILSLTSFFLLQRIRVRDDELYFIERAEKERADEKLSRAET